VTGKKKPALLIALAVGGRLATEGFKNIGRKAASYSVVYIDLFIIILYI